MFWPALHLHTTGQQKRALFACQGGPLPSATARLSLCCRALQRLLHTDHAQAARNFGVRIDIDIGVLGPGSWSLSARSSSTSDIQVERDIEIVQVPRSHVNMGQEIVPSTGNRDKTSPTARSRTRRRCSGTVLHPPFT